MIRRLLTYSQDALDISLAVKNGFSLSYTIDPCVVSSYLSPPATGTITSNNPHDHRSIDDKLFFYSAISILLETVDGFALIEPYRLELSGALEHSNRSIRLMKKYAESFYRTDLNNLRAEILAQCGEPALKTESESGEISQNYLELCLAYLARRFYHIYYLVLFHNVSKRLEKVKAILTTKKHISVSRKPYDECQKLYYKFFQEERGLPFSDLVDARALSLLTGLNDEPQGPDKKLYLLVTQAPTMFKALKQFPDALRWHHSEKALSCPIVIHPYSVLLAHFFKDNIEVLEALNRNYKDDLMGVGLDSISLDVLKNSQIQHFLSSLKQNYDSQKSEIEGLLLTMLKDQEAAKAKVAGKIRECVEVEKAIAAMTDREIHEARARNFLIYGKYLFQIDYGPEVCRLLESARLDTSAAQVVEELAMLKTGGIEEAFHLSAYWNGKLENHDEALEDIKEGIKLCGSDRDRIAKYEYLESINLANMGRFDDAIELGLTNARRRPSQPRHDLHLGYLYWRKARKHAGEGSESMLLTAITYTDSALTKARSNSPNYCHCILLSVANLVRFYTDLGDLEKAGLLLSELDSQFSDFFNNDYISERLPLFDFVKAYLGLMKLRKTHNSQEIQTICAEILDAVHECRINILVTNKQARKEYAELIKEYEKICVVASPSSRQL